MNQVFQQIVKKNTGGGRTFRLKVTSEVYQLNAMCGDLFQPWFKQTTVKTFFFE